jgi:hypothetical protein
MNMNRTSGWVCVAMVLALVLLWGCKASPAPSVGFADPKQLQHDSKIPYDKFWLKSGVDWKSYHKIYIADVNTSYMLKMTDWQKGERKDQIEKDVKDVAVYMRNAMMKAFREDPNHRFVVVDHPTKDPHTLVLEIALIELVPSKVLLNVLGYAPFYVGDAITAVRFLANDESTAAFEARTRDAATGEIVMQAADREAQPYAPVDLRGLTWYSNAEEIIDKWAKQAVEVIDMKPGQKFESWQTFRLLPW